MIDSSLDVKEIFEMKTESVFSKRPMSCLLQGAITCAGLVVAGTVGWAMDQSVLFLNGYIVAVAAHGQVYVSRLWRDFGRDTDQAEREVKKLIGMSRKQILSIDVSSTFGIALQRLVRQPDRNGELRESILNAMQSAMLEHADRILNVARSVLPSLGMAGTVFGLQLSMKAIALGVTSATDAEAMAAVIIPVVGSLGLAFTTTLSALLLGTLVLAGQADECRSAIAHYFAQLDAQLASFPFPADEEEATDDSPST